jgi:hypothetical protein
MIDSFLVHVLIWMIFFGSIHLYTYLLTKLWHWSNKHSAKATD